MNTIYEDQNVIVYFDQDKQFLEYKWTPNTEDTTTEEKAVSFQNVMQQIVQKKPNLVLNNSLEFKGVIEVESQKRVAEGVGQAMQIAQGEKYAALVPQDLLTELSYEQAKDEAEKLNLGKIFQIKYFNEYNEALEWLFA